MTDKIDFAKTLDSYQATRGEFRIVDIPEMQYLMIDGHGDPNTSPAYAEALAALYPVAYRLKFASKRSLGRDYVVPPLEGLWWADDMASFTTLRDKGRWDWTMMLMVPDWIERAAFKAAVEQSGGKAPPARLNDVRLQWLAEGRCVQTLHIGSFDAEAAVLAQMHDTFVPDHGLRMDGKHHEIYFSDFRRVAPEKLRTILRQPVAPADPTDAPKTDALPSKPSAGMIIGGLLAGLEQSVMGRPKQVAQIEEQYGEDWASADGFTVEGLGEPIDRPEPPDRSGARL